MKIQQILESIDPNAMTEEDQLRMIEELGIPGIEKMYHAHVIPTERVQLAIINKFGNFGRAIILWLAREGVQPSERIQLAAVEKNGYAIQSIIDAGIHPSEQVQLMAVTQVGDAIRYIVEAGIDPSNQVQLAAIENTNEDYLYLIVQYLTSDIGPAYIATNDISKIVFFNQLSSKSQSFVLSNPKLCCDRVMIEEPYEELVNKWVKNPRSQKKWIKYRDAVRKYYDLYPNEYKKDMEQWKQRSNEYIKSLLS